METSTKYGDLDITINLSKPEKDPRLLLQLGVCLQADIPNAFYARKTKAMQGESIIQDGIVIESFPLTWKMKDGLCSILHMSTTMNTALS